MPTEDIKKIFEEAEDLDNIRIYSKPGSELIIAFSSLGGAYDEYRYEFLKLTSSHDCSRVFCRDVKRSWYHLGTSQETNSIPVLKEKLETIIAELSPSKVTCVGASSGGFAAILFGHMLKVNTVHAFAPQTFLSESEKRWAADIEKLYSLDLNPTHRYFDLRKALEKDNKVTSYHLHFCERHEEDKLHALHVRFCPGICLHYYDCERHSIAMHLKEEGRLLGVIERH